MKTNILVSFCAFLSLQPGVKAQSFFPEEEEETTHEEEETTAHIEVDNNYCVMPSERARCRSGAIGDGTTCDALVCYNNDNLCSNVPDEKDIFEAGCYIVEGFSFLQNCRGIFAPASSKRANAVDCYKGHGIEITKPARGGCEAGGCCDTGNVPLCDLESKMTFTSEGYGIAAAPGAKCSSSVEHYGPDSGCMYLTDGNSNEALLCSNIGSITSQEAERDDLDFCHVSFAGTNDIHDVLSYAEQFFDPLSRREETYGDVSFTVIEALASVALGSKEDEEDGIVEIVYRQAEEMGCFDRPGAAMALYGHSLGGAMADILALMIGGYQPDVHVEITTLDGPALLVEPLSGPAAELPVWDTKEQYVAGVVMPRGPIFKDFFLVPRPYGYYQNYDVVSQVFPGGYYANSTGTSVDFLCEVLSPDGQQLEYFISPGWEGCASGRDEHVLNDMPDFPHRGGLERNDESDLDENLRVLLWILRYIFGRPIDDEVVEALNVVATIADVNLREDFWLVLDLHMMRRGLHFANLLTDDGAQCDRKSISIDLL